MRRVNLTARPLTVAMIGGLIGGLAAAAGLLTDVTHAGPPGLSDDLDYQTAGYMIPPGVDPATFLKSINAPVAGPGRPPAGNPAAGPLMDPRTGMPVGMMPGGMNPGGMGMPMGMGGMGLGAMGGGGNAAMGMPGMGGPGGNTPMMGRPGMVGPMYGPAPGSSGGAMPPGMGGPSHGPMMPPQAMMMPPRAMMPPAGGIAPVGYYSSPACDVPCDMPGMMMGCDCGSCDGSCGTGCGCGCGDGRSFNGLLPELMGRGGACGCGGGEYCGDPQCCGCRAVCSPILGGGGVLGKMCGCGDGSGNGLADYCLFCRGEGCSVCQGLIGGGQLLGLLGALRPYADGGRHAQRWYDVSVELLLLRRELDAFDNDSVLTNLGTTATPGVADNAVLRLSDAQDDDLEAGARISLAMILGVGGNLEATYMGGQDFGGSASVSRQGNTNLTSFLSGFGTLPQDGFANLQDRQSVTTEADFHSVEINYRRRTVGPYGRFQGSWLAGIRHVVFDNDFLFQGFGAGGSIESFSQNTQIENRFLGAQLGGDVWWNVVPGINLGVGYKGAWGQVDYDRDSTTINGALAPAFFNDGDNRGSYVGELNTTLIYRLSHSLSYRMSYHLIGLGDFLSPGLDPTDFTNETTVISNATGLPVTNRFLALPTAPQARTFDDVTLSGLTFGMEYLW